MGSSRRCLFDQRVLRRAANLSAEAWGRVAHELTTTIGWRGRTHVLVSDNGTELTSLAILRWSK
jgi:hypothetical protein